MFGTLIGGISCGRIKFSPYDLISMMMLDIDEIRIENGDLLYFSTKMSTVYPNFLPMLCCTFSEIVNIKLIFLNKS